MLKKIECKTTLVLTLDEAKEYNKLIERNEIADGIPYEGKYGYLNECPVCGHVFNSYDSFCGSCGKRVKFVPEAEANLDYIPFSDTEGE